MICPECNRRYDGSQGSCPNCGVVKGVVKTSTILIASGSTQMMYRSVDEVPDPLRTRLIRSTNGLNSATIVIADRQGRKEIAKAIRSLPVAGANDSHPDNVSLKQPVAKLSPTVLRSAALILLVLALTVVWLVFHE